MSLDSSLKSEDCNCFVVRSAARHVTQLYDQFLAPVGLHVTQFSILAKLKRLGPMTINALAKEMVMDRTTLGRSRHRFATRIARFAPEPSLNSHVSRIIRASSTADMDYSTRDDGNAVTSILHKVNM